MYASNNAIHPKSITETTEDMKILGFQTEISQAHSETIVAVNRESISDIKKYFHAALLAILRLISHFISKYPPIIPNIVKNKNTKR